MDRGPHRPDRRVVAGLALTLVLLAVSTEAAEAPPFALDVAASASQEVALTVPPNALVPLTIIRTSQTGAPGSIDLLLSEFTGEQGNSISVDLSIPGEPKRQQQRQQRGVKVSGPLLPIRLAVPKLPTGGKYTGRLILIADGKDLLVWKIVLTGLGGFRPATLLLDRGAVTFNVTLPLIRWQTAHCLPQLGSWRPLCWGPTEEPHFSVHLREKSGQWLLERVAVRLEQVTKAPAQGFDVNRNLAFWFNDVAIADFGASPAPGERVVQVGAQATVRMALRNLNAGEYNAILRFQAANSVDDDGQRLVLAVQVRHPIWGAIGVLLVALILSFLATKFVGMLRQRAAFLQRLREIRPSWLSQEPLVLPVVWVRALLRQAEDLSHRFWLTGQSQIDARLGQVSGLISVLARVRQIRQEFDQYLPKDFVKVRAIVALSRIISRLDASPLSEQATAQFVKELDALANWIQANQQQAYYWAELSDAINDLLAEVKLDAITDPIAKPIFARLVTTLANPNMPPNLRAMMDLEGEYARLKILWERRNTPEFPLLVAKEQAREPLAAIFHVADEEAWRRLMQAPPEQFQIVLPQAIGLDPIEAYDPLIFKLETTAAVLAQTHLFLHGLRYEWTFRLEHKHGSLVLKPVTTEPQVVQYMPKPGTLTVSVTIRRNGATKGVGPTQLAAISRSRDFSLWKAFERVDFLAFAIAGVVAIVSGLAMFYAKNPSFGTLQDYLSLFTWAAGVDQGKNLVQALQTYSSGKAS
jgi:hypothetical protein